MNKLIKNALNCAYNLFMKYDAQTFTLDRKSVV